MAGRFGGDRSLTVGGVDLSSAVNSIHVDQMYDVGEVTATNSSNKEYAMSTKPDATITIDFNWSNAASGVFQTLNGFKGTAQAITAVYDSTASAGDIVTVTGSFNISNVPAIPGAKHDEIETVSVTWQPAGAVTVAIT